MAFARGSARQYRHVPAQSSEGRELRAFFRAACPWEASAECSAEAPQSRRDPRGAPRDDDPADGICDREMTRTGRHAWVLAGRSCALFL